MHVLRPAWLLFAFYIATGFLCLKTSKGIKLTTGAEGDLSNCNMSIISIISEASYRQNGGKKSGK